MGARKFSRTIEVLAGASIGLLVGAILGLSISQVAGVVLGGLTSVLALFFGLTDVSSFLKKTDTIDQSTVPGSPLRIMSFSAFCLIGLIVGVVARNNDLLSPAIGDQVNAIVAEKSGDAKDSIFSIEEAKAIVLYEKFGLVDKTRYEVRSNSVRLDTVLYAGDSAGIDRLCDPNKYANVPERVLQAWESSSDRNLVRASAVIRKYVSTEQQSSAILDYWSMYEKQ